VLLITAILIVSHSGGSSSPDDSAQSQSDQLALPHREPCSIRGGCRARHDAAASAQEVHGEAAGGEQNIRLLPATTWDMDRLPCRIPRLAAVSEQLKRRSGWHHPGARDDRGFRSGAVDHIRVQGAGVVGGVSGADRLRFTAPPVGRWSLESLAPRLAGGLRSWLRRPIVRCARSPPPRRTSAPQDTGGAAGEGPSEIRTLSHAFTSLSDAAETARRQSPRWLLAGVSHDLRTPLSRLRLASR